MSIKGVENRQNPPKHLAAGTGISIQIGYKERFS
jgi:hypothetical protein